MRSTAPVALIAATVAAAGCGHVGGSRQPPAGAAVFAGNCRACHSLVGNESRHRQGGDLAGYRLTREELVQFTREMPTRRPLTSKQLDAVVDYILAIQRRDRAR